jgi:hypothetical protein
MIPRKLLHIFNAVYLWSLNYIRPRLKMIQQTAACSIVVFNKVVVFEGNKYIC